MRHSTTLALAVAQLVLAVKGDMDLDMDDVSASCKAICQPIGTLTDSCDVDLPRDNDRDERLLQNQCICTNESFQVANIAALCADCMRQFPGKDRDDEDDIKELVSVCGFTSTATYSSAAASLAAGVTVVATRPTDISQLTTTIDRGSPATGGAGGAGGSSGSPTSSASAGASRGSASGTPAADPSSAAASSQTGNAAPAMTAQAAYAVGGLVAAAYLLG